MDVNELYQAIREKSLESLQNLIAQRDSGAVSNAEARVAIKTLFDAVAGYAGTEVMDLISEGSKEISEGRDRFTVLRRLFIAKDGSLTMLEYQYGETEVTLKMRAANSTAAGWDRFVSKSFVEFSCPSIMARQRFDEYVSGLLRQGYKELT